MTDTPEGPRIEPGDIFLARHAFMTGYVSIYRIKRATAQFVEVEVWRQGNTREPAQWHDAVSKVKKSRLLRRLPHNADVQKIAVFIDAARKEKEAAITEASTRYKDAIASLGEPLYVGA